MLVFVDELHGGCGCDRQQSYDLELYVLDYDKAGRSEQIQFTNASTGTVLSTADRVEFLGRRLHELDDLGERAHHHYTKAGPTTPS